jgi:hypothetical protein
MEKAVERLKDEKKLKPPTPPHPPGGLPKQHGLCFEPHILSTEMLLCCEGQVWRFTKISRMFALMLHGCLRR